MITKETYWNALDDPEVSNHLERTNRLMICLKHIQDAWILSKLAGVREQKILEAGGGFGRVLRTLDGNERWNLDKPNGSGRTVDTKKIVMPKEFHVISTYLGEYNDEVPAEYFDFVFSISVIEHIPKDHIDNFFADHFRILKAGGLGYHAIDFYLGNEELQNVETRIDSYLQGVRRAGLEFLRSPILPRPLVFHTEFATNPDLTMRYWNETVPRLASSRLSLQSVSLALAVKKAI
ncbi:MAG: methyltransferase domain-containing protein [Pseudomonadota bacterium]